MTPTLKDRSFGQHHLDWRLTMTAHCLIPVDRNPGRPSVLQAELILTPLPKNAVAKISVLSDNFAWTLLLALPASEWLPDVDRTSERATENSMDLIADRLMRRAVEILEPS